MVISRIYGGLGNQLFQYFAGLYLSKSTKNKLLLFPSSKVYGHVESRKFELLNFQIDFDVYSPPTFLSFLDKHGFLDLLTKINFNYFSIRKTIIINNLLSDYKIHNNENSYLLISYYQTLSYFFELKKNSKISLNKNFTLSNFAKNILRKINSSNSISVHVRRGDYLYSRSHNVLNLSYYEKVFNLLNKKSNIFVFSDDIEWCRNNFPKHEKIFFVDNKSKMSSLEDFELMRHCKINVISNSTFSLWASLLNYNESVIFAPYSYALSFKLSDFLSNRLNIIR